MLILLLVISVILNIILVISLIRAVNIISIYENYCEMVLTRLADILHDIRAVDIRGSFEADDEVGTVYKAISGLIKTLIEFVPQNEDSNGS